MHFSIAMCTFNGERHLGEQLQSIASQALLPGELVVCDDCSVDNTVEILRRFAMQAPFPVRIFENPVNVGYRQNFANAIARCTEEFIALADQDDVWYPQKLQRLAGIFLQHGDSIAGVFSNGDLIDSNSTPLEGDMWSSFGFTTPEQNHFKNGKAIHVLLRRNVVTGMTLAFRSAWRDQLQNMPASWHHDAWLAFRLAARSTVVACPDHLVAYRVHGAQQIGVPIGLRAKLSLVRRNGMAGYFDISRTRNLKEYEECAHQFEDLATVLRLESDPRCAWLLPEALGKAEHARASLALLLSHRWRRLPALMRGVNSHRRYSPTGLRAALRDLIL
jgi:glycosyltransferase involved in cell wall biosynthesis